MKENKIKVLEFLENRPDGATRKEISEKFNIPRTTVFDMLKYEPDIKRIAITNRKRGRPEIIWRHKKYE